MFKTKQRVNQPMNQWQVGETVKIGFMLLIVLDVTGDVATLESKGKRYEFTPYQGLINVD